ncbi:hypothetical protein ANANG_G00087460 [Anguilla anguilla]|uniref:Axonemal dynein light chain domain containing 1 n=1 Tax=Anguilla anguilla TaxID=7936 RepID=A0A9D3S5K1_ANGAN|nr:hypothetical protein ANANG_G00087460 [Anguilla anguilla]
MNSTVDEMRELPELKEKFVPEKRSKMKLTPLHNDLIPDELLTTLISTVSPLERSLEAPKITKTPKDFKICGMRHTDAVWQHPLARKKYKHLLDQPTSATGAGRDISFLCDAMVSQRTRKPLSEMAVRGSTQDLHKDPNLEESLIPAEYHVVKNKGVMGLKCYEDKYTVLLEDEEKRLRVFPSMKPSSRLEVLQLKKVMDEMLDKAGVNQEHAELENLSQMEGLLELVRVEQDIYNTIFHELIRQVSVHCAERGQLLAKLRQRYVALLERIPQQMKGLHTQALAQRALDRRRMEEITGLKKSIAQLNNELSEIKGHNEHVSQQAEMAQQNLAKAQEELHRTSDLVAEHRELYEMQRRRLEGQVTRLTDERDLWSKVTHSLAVKVIKANKLQLASRLDVSNQAWIKTAQRFTALLTTKDTEDMRHIVKLTDQWKDEVTAFTQRLNDTEERQCKEIRRVQAGITQWQAFCEANINRPDVNLEESQDKLFFDLKQWSLLLTAQCERYGGEDLLSCQETLNHFSQLQDDWVGVSLQLFRRHPGLDREPFKGQETVWELERAVSELHKQLRTRITGESGVHKLLISLIGAMERWTFKLMTVKDQTETLPQSDWLNLEKDLGSWTKLTEEAMLQVSSPWADSERVKKTVHIRIEINSVFAMLREFVSMQDIFFDCENQRLSDEASSVHSALTRWMVDLLLLMVPDFSDDQEPPLHSDPVPHALVTVSFQELEEDGKRLTQKLDLFSKYLTSSCLPIVEDDLQKQLAGDESENELAELSKLQRECEVWTEACRCLLLDIKGAPVDAQETVVSQSIMDILPSEKTSEDSMRDEDTEPPSDTEEVEEEAVSEGEEENSEPMGKFTERSYSRKSIGHDSSTAETTPGPESTLPVRTSQDVARSPTPNTERDLDALATVQTLHLQLLGAESRAQSAEEHAQRTEKALQAALEKVRDLELQLKARAVELRENKKTELVTSQRAVTADPRSVSQKPDPSPKQRRAPKKH